LSSRDVQAVGVVVRSHGPRFWVDAHGREVACGLRGKLRQQQERVTSPIVVGDEVLFQTLPDRTGVISEIRPRRSELRRPGFAHRDHVIAANVDQLLIVQSAAQPDFKRHLVERFLAAARHGRMGAVLAVTKADLVPEEEIRSWIAPLGEVPAVLTSSTDGRGIEALRALLVGKSTVLAGKSGAGKSTLVNLLYPGLEVKTAEVSAAHGKGRHTTTASRLYPLPGGGYLVDTPGIRELGLFDDEEAVESVFPEIAAAAEACRFRDCAHRGDPGCAVTAAVARGAIDADRYEHYLRLVGGG
jgi:ribosome biogenesis GTPase